MLHSQHPCRYLLVVSEIAEFASELLMSLWRPRVTLRSLYDSLSMMASSDLTSEVTYYGSQGVMMHKMYELKISLTQRLLRSSAANSWEEHIDHWGIRGP